MHCATCALLIDDTLADLPGVITSATSSKDQRSTITHDDRADLARIVAAIEGLGYHAAPVTAA